MKKAEVLEKIREVGIISVIRNKSADEAQSVIKAILAGGINILEITMTIPDAVELIGKLTQELNNEVIIGAGTVLDVEAAQKCIEAGARFIVSPIFDAKIVSLCNQSSIAVMSGALTPTEIFTAWQNGADLVKVFPVSAVGGASYLKAVKAVFPHIELVPTGGVNLENATSLIEAGAFAVGIGGELTAGYSSMITELARNLCSKVRS
jgi:2-dehydro-3-deoxyphosphogluconate aldolase/(4S)-4-hydroxy-2-oxoglutarate aldolase